MPTRGKLVVQGPGEKAGVVDIGDGPRRGLQDRIAQLIPATSSLSRARRPGSAGIWRDILQPGRAPIAVLDSLRFGVLATSKYTSEEELRKPPHPRRPVIRGIGSYGNCFGVPTIGGEVASSLAIRRIRSSTLLLSAIAKKEEIFLAKAKGIGNPVIYVGAKNRPRRNSWRSLLASAEFTEESKQKRPNVQVGDPFMEKLLLESLPRSHADRRGRGDSGHGRRRPHLLDHGNGFPRRHRHRDRPRQSSPTRNRHDALRNHAQRIARAHATGGGEGPRACSPRRLQEVGPRCRCGRQVTEGGIARINNNGRVAAEIPAHPLAEEGPVYQRPIAAPAPRKETAGDWFTFAAEGTNLTQNFLKLLASAAIASKRWITEQYDSSVRTNTLAGPGASDAQLFASRIRRRES